MGQFDFTYELPNNFNSRLIKLHNKTEVLMWHKRFNNVRNMNIRIRLSILCRAKRRYWNKKAVDFTFEGSEKDISLLKSRNEFLKKIINKALKPRVSGYLVKEGYYII